MPDLRDLGKDQKRWNYCSQTVQTGHYHTVALLKPGRKPWCMWEKPVCVTRDWMSVCSLKSCCGIAAVWALDEFAPLQQKTAKPETSRSWDFRQMWICKQIQGRTKVFGKVEGDMGKHLVLGGLRMCTHRTTNRKCIAAPLLLCALPL